MPFSVWKCDDPATRLARWWYSPFETARAAVAVGDQPGQRRDRDLARRARPEVEADRPVDAGDVVGAHAELRERGRVRRRVTRAADHTDPAGPAGERLLEHLPEFGAVMVGDHDVGVVVTGNGGDCAFRGIAFRVNEDGAETGVAAEVQQVLGDRSGKDRDGWSCTGLGRRDLACRIFHGADCAITVHEMRRLALPAVATAVALLIATPADASAARPGAPGVGDAYFPLAGNGGYDVRHYDLDIRYTPSTKAFAGVASISARAVSSLSSFNLDLRGFTVRSVVVDGRAAAFTRDGKELTVTPRRDLRRGANFTVVVRYDGTTGQPTDNTGALYGWVSYDDGAFVA